MSDDGAVVTPDFVARIVVEGRLAEAAARVRAGTARPRGAPTGLSTWALVCEEVLDTDYDPEVYDGIVVELLARGLDFARIDRMRALAWETAGWLNYDRMLWDWTSLDEADMRLALRWQLAGGLITAAERDERLGWIEDPQRIPEGR